MSWPLTYEESQQRINQIIYVSATLHSASLSRRSRSQQIIRPTGPLDPVIEIRALEGQMDDLLGEIRLRAEK